ncbi:MAG TPA: hypothetical protein VHE11_14630, partial [Steroidobacteraceae bacterium]|nr:hypothetical protein [Steroidobacteraceae bacterium]
GIVGPAIFANLFALFIGNHAPTRRLPGAAFVLAAMLVLAALLLTERATRRNRLHSQVGEPSAT